MTTDGQTEKLDIMLPALRDLDALAPLAGHGFENVRNRDERGALRQLEEVLGLGFRLTDVDRALLIV